jgi:hypothetical protein
MESDYAKMGFKRGIELPHSLFNKKAGEKSVGLEVLAPKY